MEYLFVETRILDPTVFNVQTMQVITWNESVNLFKLMVTVERIVDETQLLVVHFVGDFHLGGVAEYAFVDAMLLNCFFHRG